MIVDSMLSARSQEILAKRFRAHFIPQLIHGREIQFVIVPLMSLSLLASLKVDLLPAQGTQACARRIPEN